LSSVDEPDQERSTYALYQTGQTRLANGRPREAAEALEQAVEQEPDKASLHETLGRAYFATSRVQAARAAFEAALALDPSDDYAHFGVGRCFERQGQLSEAAKHFKLACALADRSDYREALGRVLARLGTSES
jgi:tetratricopeptide (TPR) repeat protein